MIARANNIKNGNRLAKEGLIIEDGNGGLTLTMDQETLTMEFSSTSATAGANGAGSGKNGVASLEGGAKELSAVLLLNDSATSPSPRTPAKVEEGGETTATPRTVEDDENIVLISVWH